MFVSRERISITEQRERPKTMLSPEPSFSYMHHQKESKGLRLIPKALVNPS